jgi:hypothetical protein
MFGIFRTSKILITSVALGTAFFAVASRFWADSWSRDLSDFFRELLHSVAQAVHRVGVSLIIKASA